MSLSHVTTPFGRGPMTLAMVASQASVAALGKNAVVDKWAVYRNLCESKQLLELSDRALAVLYALLSFHPKPELAQTDQLIVFPSNAQLSNRSHGMAEQTIRRHLAALVSAGLIIRHDSPNGKRYARKERGGRIFQAFGFSLAPLLARHHEFQDLADKVRAERLYFQSLKDELSLAKRDIAKSLELLRGEQPDSSWDNAEMRLREILSDLPRRPSTGMLEIAVRSLREIQVELNNFLISLKNDREVGGNPCQNERHQESHESESKKEDTVVDVAVSVNSSLPSKRRPPVERQKLIVGGLSVSPTLSLQAILSLCNAIVPYGPGGRITGWNDLLSACSLVQAMTGISRQVYETASNKIGRIDAALAVAYILERGEEIDAPNAYFQHMTAKAHQGNLAITALIQSLARRRSQRDEPLTTTAHE